MNVCWTFMVMLWTWTLMRKIRNTNKTIEYDNAPPCFVTVIVMGIIIALLDAHVIYDGLVSKTRRLVSIDVVRSHVANTLSHNLVFLWIGHTILIGGDCAFKNIFTILGLTIGFVLSMFMLTNRHTNMLQKQI